MRLDDDLNIVKIIKRQRDMLNLLKQLTTHKERRLAKMQANQNVIQLHENERELLQSGQFTLEEATELHSADSSNYNSGDD